MARKPQGGDAVNGTSAAADAEVNELTYGLVHVSIDSLPKQTLVALMQRGFSHCLGNEVASKVTAWKKANPLPADASEEDTADYESKVEELTDSHRAEMLSKMQAGQLGVRAGGPRGTAFDTIVRQVAEARAKTLFTKNNVGWFKKADDTRNIGGKVYTKAEYLAAYIEKNGESIRAEAKRRQEEEEADAGEIEI